jgi:TolB-like protein/Tfp pilus assembly protein PilF
LTEPIPTGAIFISYAREDTDAARRVADALRAFGLEVWFDQNELRGGDAWDQKIKRQIRECTLFMPIISAKTQERGEGYFRREWKLGVERTHDMAAGVPFIVPVVIDDTPADEASVPEEFLRYQWTLLKHGVPSSQFVEQVTNLLKAPKKATGARAVAAPVRAPGEPAAAGHRISFSLMLLAGFAVLVAGLVSYMALRPRRSPQEVAQLLAMANTVVAQANKAAEVAPTAAPIRTDNTIAVLPFENMSEDKDNSAFFADGVHEDILTNLSFIRDLHVVSRTSVMQYRGTTKSIGQIARELGVAYVLEGSVRRAGTKVRVTGQLIRAATDEHVWAKAYDRDITDVFAIQAELAQAIASALQAAISPAEKSLLESKPTTNTAAYDLYLKARSARNTSNVESTIKAESWLVDAVQLDPSFAQAWAQLGALHAYKHFNDDDSTPERLAKAKAAIGTAVRLAPDDPVVIEMQGDYFYYGYRDYAHAAAQYQRLLEMRPNSPEAYGSLGLIYRRQGRWEDSVANFRKALELDPHMGRYRSSLAEQLLAARRFDEARAEYQRMAEDSSGDSFGTLFWSFQAVFVPFAARGSTKEATDWFSHYKPQPGDEGTFIAIRKGFARVTGDFATALRLDAQQPYFEKFNTPHWQQDVDTAWDYIGSGDREGGRARLEKILPELRAESVKQPHNSTVWAYLGTTEATLGNRDQALAAAQTLAQLIPEGADAVSGPDVSRSRAQILAWVGEKDEAIAEYSRLLHVPYGGNVNLARVDPGWLPIRDDPRFKAVLADPKNNEPLF